MWAWGGGGDISDYNSCLNFPAGCSKFLFNNMMSAECMEGGAGYEAGEKAGKEGAGRREDSVPGPPCSLSLPFRTIVL